MPSATELVRTHRPDFPRSGTATPVSIAPAPPHSIPACPNVDVHIVAAGARTSAKRTLSRRPNPIHIAMVIRRTSTPEEAMTEETATANSRHAPRPLTMLRARLAARLRPRSRGMRQRMGEEAMPEPHHRRKVRHRAGRTTRSGRMISATAMGAVTAGIADAGDATSHRFRSSRSSPTANHEAGTMSAARADSSAAPTTATCTSPAMPGSRPISSGSTQFAEEMSLSHPPDAIIVVV